MQEWQCAKHQALINAIKKQISVRADAQLALNSALPDQNLRWWATAQPHKQ